MDEISYIEADAGVLSTSYPAGIGVEKPPPNTVVTDCFHAATAVQEDCQHSLSKVDYLLILLGAGWFGGVVCHGVLFRNWWDNESGVQPSKSVSQ